MADVSTGAHRPDPARRLSVVIPAFNEREGLPVTLRSLLATVPGAEVIVVDDGSRDGTADTLKEFPGVVCVRHLFNRGYGGALKTGMRQAKREFVAWFDADNEHRASDLSAMLDRIVEGGFVAIIAQRRHTRHSPLRDGGKFLIRMLARSFYSKIGRDINCGLRIFQRDMILRHLSILPNGYSASITSTLVMLERGYPVAFHPVDLNAGIGRSKVKITDGYTALILVLRTIMLFGPLRIFLTAGIIFSIVGLAYSVGLAVAAGLGIPTGGLLVILSGVLLAMFGLVADQVSQMRLAQYDDASFEVVQPGEVHEVDRS
jgi:glycosyltransferase involved in cell wall biosynthesis